MSQPSSVFNNVTTRRTTAIVAEDSGVDETRDEHKTKDLCFVIQNLLSEVKSLKEQTKSDMQRIEKKQDDVLKYVEGEYVALKENIKKDITSMSNELGAKIEETLSEVDRLKEKVNKMDHILTRQPSNTIDAASVVVPNLSGLISKIEPPQFMGKLNENPVMFLKKLEGYFQLIACQDDQFKLALLANCLLHETKVWWNLIEPTISSFEEFKKEFKTKFWSLNRQREILNNLRFGKYDPIKGISREQYVLEIISLVQCLEANIQENEIINLNVFLNPIKGELNSMSLY